MSRSVAISLLAAGLSIVAFMIIYRRLAGSKGTYSIPTAAFLGDLWSAGMAPRNRVNDMALYRPRPSPESGPKSIGEQLTCRALQELLGKPFTSQRPNFLKSPVTGHNLEIDCFNASLRLGAEYNGRQHYHFTPKFHRSYREFREGQYRDVIKATLCKEHGIKLITVPYTVPHRNIKHYIAAQLRAGTE